MGSIPVAVLNGNHEEPGSHQGKDGDNIDTIISANCLPKPSGLNIQESPALSGSTGTASTNYGREYFYDYPATNPTTRLISASPDILTFGGGNYDYSVGSTHYNWVKSTIQDAKKAGLWVVVSAHTPYITAGGHASDDYSTVKDFFNLLLDEKVDLILAGHSHDYQRSKQLGGPACTVTYNAYSSSCVVNSASTGYVAGQGSVFVITGTGGGNKASEVLTPIVSSDPDYPYFATTMGSNSPNKAFGFSKFTVTGTSITGTFVPGVGQTGGFTDTFTITKPAAVDSEAPTVSLTAPTRNELVTGVKTFAADAKDNVGVAKVEFYVGGASPVCTDTTAPFTCDWPSTTHANGDVVVTAKAYDAADNKTVSAPVTITVGNPVGSTDTEDPVVSLTAPAKGTALSGSVSIKATATDNVGVTKVEFYNGITPLGQSTTAPYSISWLTTTVPNGSATITARAFDAAGNKGDSSPINVTINNPAQAAPVTFTVPGAEAPIGFSAAGSCGATTVVSQAKTAPAEVTGTVLAGAGFSLNCGTQGASAAVTINLGKTYDKKQLRVFKQIAGKVTDITTNVSILDTDVAGKAVTTIAYTVVDGGFGDDDKTANNKIVDPIFVSLAPATTNPPAGTGTLNPLAPEPGLGGELGAGASEPGELANTGAGRYALIAGSVLALGLGLLAAVVFLRKSKNEEPVVADTTIISN